MTATRWCARCAHHATSHRPGCQSCHCTEFETEWPCRSDECVGCEGPGHHEQCPLWTAPRDEAYYRAKLRSLLADRLPGPPGVECHYCQGQPGEWCEYDCGSPFPVLHPEYRSGTPLDRVRALALREQHNGGLVDPADILAALDGARSARQ